MVWDLGDRDWSETAVSRPSRLMVIIPDRLSELVRKGEITARYYNPGEIFPEVHLVMTNDDRPDLAAVQPMVGAAKLFLHNLPAGAGLFAASLGWRPWLLGAWTDRAVALAEQINPDLVRCHGAHLNAFAARTIKRKLGIPYAVSLHTEPDTNVRSGLGGLRAALLGYAGAGIEKAALHDADLVLPVYQAIVPYLESIGVRRYEVAYNVLNPAFLRKKDDYALHAPVRVVSVGRLIPGKNPGNLIRAVAGLPDVALTIIGNGPEAPKLRDAAADSGAARRVIFHPAIANDKLCALLPEFDIFAIHSDYLEMPKSVLEALLTGLPVVINRRPGEPVPELSDEICLLVNNTAESYRTALDRLIADHVFRERLGRAAYSHARAHWSPAKTEAVYVEAYRSLIAAHRRGRAA
jgi:glycosyltransferase involved in cell wall biosynthesis